MNLFTGYKYHDSNNNRWAVLRITRNSPVARYYKIDDKGLRLTTGVQVSCSVPVSNEINTDIGVAAPLDWQFIETLDKDYLE